MRASLVRVLDDLQALPGASPVRAAVSGVRIGSLADLSGIDVCGAGELVAGVLAHFNGRFDQVGLFAMEPQAAYELVRELESDDPLGAYCALGCSLVEATARGIDPAGVTQEGDATLQEDSVIGTLLRTHAASDAAIIAISLDLSSGGAEASRLAHVYVLADSKPFSAAIAAA